MLAKAKGIAGRRPRRPSEKNLKYIGKEIHEDASITYTMKTDSGRVVEVRYNSDGYPDFSPYEYKGTDGKARVDIEYSGNRQTDVARANEKAGFTDTPEGYTWHHVENCTTLMTGRNDI